VSALSSRKPGFARSLFFSANWALGHGGVLLIAGLLLFGLGMGIPAVLQQFAEASVGVLLIGLGIWCFYRFRQQKLLLQQHSHDDVVHTHWHKAGHEEGKQKEAHAPVMVGMLHGLAGSAPALALVPAVAEGQVAIAIVYLLLFSFGVMCAMLMFGSGLGFIQSKLQKHNQRLFDWSRYGIATASILLGGFWLSSSVLSLPH
jgi:sulfite exporter TauE/SafE